MYFSFFMLAWSNVGNVIVIVVHTKACESVLSEGMINENRFKMIKAIVEMEFTGEKIEALKNSMNDLAHEKIKAEIKDWNRKEVLIYDVEDSETTRCFFKELKTLTPKYRFTKLPVATIKERQKLPIFAIVKHSTLRFQGYLEEIIQKLFEANVSDIGNVTVVYFHCTALEETTCTSLRNLTTEYKQFKFHKLVLLDFVGNSLRKYQNILKFDFNIKNTNRKALEELMKNDFDSFSLKTNLAICLEEASSIAMEYECVLTRMLSRYTWISLHRISYVNEVNMPTVICSTRPLDESIRIEEKNMQKVFFIHITTEEDAEEDKTNAHCSKDTSSTQYGSFMKVKYRSVGPEGNNSFLADMRYLDTFEDFANKMKSTQNS